MIGIVIVTPADPIVLMALATSWLLALDLPKGKLLELEAQPQDSQTQFISGR